MRAVLGFTLLAALCVAVAWWVAGLPGSVAVTLLGTTVETSTPVAITLVAVLFVAIYAVVRLVVGLFASPGRFLRAQRLKNRRKGDRAITRTLVALAANDIEAARREADRSRRLLGESPLTLLLSAQTERQAGRDDEAQAIFERLAKRPDARLLGLRGQLRLASGREDWEAATRFAQQAEEAYPGSAWLKDERKRMALVTGRYREALRLMGPPRRRDAASNGMRAALGVAAAGAETDKKAALTLAKEAFEADSTLAPAALAYAARLSANGKARAAQDVLRRSWSLAPHPDVAEAYLDGNTDKLVRHRAVSGLVSANPSHPDSALLLARTALEAGLTSDARRHAETARQAGLNDRRLYVLLADIAEVEGDREASQEALRQIPGAAHEPGWRCQSCGVPHAAWLPVCDACGTPGQIKWSSMEVVRTIAPRMLPPATIEGIT